MRAVLLPGLVNAHTHLELCALRGQVAGGRGFVPWVETMLAARARLHPEQDDARRSRLGVSELLAAGTAAVGEVSNSLAALPALASAPLLACVFHEVFGMRKDSGRGDARHGRAAARRGRHVCPRNLSYTPAPHTPYTPAPGDAAAHRRGGARARSARRRCTCASTPRSAPTSQTAAGRSRVSCRGVASSPVDWPPPGQDPVRYAQALGVLGPDVLCVHLTDARPDEIAVLAEAHAQVVLCPRSNLHIELKLPPLLELRKAGLRPGLGTDSLASNASLDVLDEARALARALPERACARPARDGDELRRRCARALGSASAGCARGSARACSRSSTARPRPSEPERFVLSRAAAAPHRARPPEPRSLDDPKPPRRSA